MTARPLRLPSVVLLALALLPAAASAQPAPTPRQPPPLPGAESHLFRYLLNLAGVRPVANNELWNVNRSNMDDLVLVVIGGTNWDVGGRSLDKWLDEVPRGGGSVLFLSKTGNKFQQPWGAREQQEVDLTGHVVSAGFNSPHFANRRECPFVVPVTPDEQPFRPRKPGPIWDLFAGLDRVVTYYPSYFVTDRPGPEYRDRLARFPEGSVVSNGLTLPRNAAFARGGEGPHPDTGKPFRYVAMADQDVFTNRLLVAPETDNLVLTRRTVFYLVDPPTANNPDGAGRKRCLFVENGRVISDFKAAEYIFQPPTPLPPVPPLGKIQDKIVDAGNQIIDRLETNDALNRSILGGSDPDRQERNLRNIIGVLLAVAAVFGSIMLLTRVWGKKQPLDVPNPPVTGTPAGADPAAPAGIFDRRHRELTRRDDVSEPVRAIVRTMFLDAGAPADAGGKLPKVEISDAVRRPETLRRALADLWRVGFGPPAKLTVRRWETLEPLFLRARRAYTDGKWLFATTWDHGGGDPPARHRRPTPRRS